MDDNNKDLTCLSRYLNLLQEAMRIKEDVPSRINTEMFNKYYKLYSDEHVRLFGREPDDSKIFNENNADNNINADMNKIEV